MGHANVKDEQFRVIEDVVRGRDTFVSLPTWKEGAYSIVLSGGYDDGKVLAMLMKFYQRVCLAFETFQCLKQL
eukprot:Em0030g25a